MSALICKKRIRSELCTQSKGPQMGHDRIERCPMDASSLRVFLIVSSRLILRVFSSCFSSVQDDCAGDVLCDLRVIPRAVPPVLLCALWQKEEGGVSGDTQGHVVMCGVNTTICSAQAGKPWARCGLSQSFPLCPLRQEEAGGVSVSTCTANTHGLRPPVLITHTSSSCLVLVLGEAQHGASRLLLGLLLL